MTLTIRPATRAEREDVVDLWRRAGLTVPHNDPYVDFDLALARPGSDVLVGEVDGAIVASALVGHDGHRGWVYYVSVDPNRQKQGYGAEIMTAAENWVRARGVRKLQLMVRDTNAGAKGFYEAIGYEQAQVSVLAKWLD